MQGKVEEVVTFLNYLIDRVEAVHYKDPNPTEVKEIANSYDHGQEQHITSLREGIS